MFAYFNVKCGKGKDSSVKKVFNITTLEDNECIPRRSGGKSKSLESELMHEQKRLKKETETNCYDCSKGYKDYCITGCSCKRRWHGNKFRKGMCTSNVVLQERVKELEAKNRALIVKNEELTQQLLKAYTDTNERMEILLRPLSKGSS